MLLYELYVLRPCILLTPLHTALRLQKYRYSVYVCKLVSCSVRWSAGRELSQDIYGVADVGNIYCMYYYMSYEYGGVYIYVYI